MTLANGTNCRRLNLRNGITMKTNAVIMTGPKKLSVESLVVNEPQVGEVVVEISYSALNSAETRNLASFINAAGNAKLIFPG